MNTESVRRPAVAGSFYPADQRVLRGQVESLLDTADEKSLPALKALICPHAGYIYSGPIAAKAYAALRDRAESIERVVLLGPSHRVPVRGLALPTVAAFATPLGEVRIDRRLAEAIIGLPQVVADDSAHAFEHSLEVQLPFLQSVLDDFLLLPLAVGRASAVEVAEVLEHVWGGPETLIVISSDLSHYLPYAEARRVDQASIEQILNLDPALDHQQACGATPTNGLVLAARAHRLRPTLLDLRNSGDTAGDKHRVVGYAALAFTETA